MSYIYLVIKAIPNASSLSIKKKTLMSFLNNSELSKYLNKKITTFDISRRQDAYYFESDEIDLLYEIFSNLE